MGSTSSDSAATSTTVPPTTSTPSITTLTPSTTTTIPSITTPTPSTTTTTTIPSNTTITTSNTATKTTPVTTTNANTTATTTTPVTTTNTNTTTTATATAAASTTTTTATATTPTAAIKSAEPTAAVTKDTSTTLASTEGASRPTFYSVAVSLTSNAEQKKPAASAAIAQWYKWSKFEQKQQDKSKALWYMGSKEKNTDTPTTTTTVTTTKVDDDHKETSATSDIAAVPSFQLRSTAVYSPPHGDRIISGRNELINTDTSSFKYYAPDNQSQQTVGIHTKATMYKMNTRLKQTPLPTQSSSTTTTNSISDTNVIEGNSSLPTFVSRGLQTDLEVQPADQSSTQIRYYEKEQPKIVPISAFSNVNSSNNGFFHLTSSNTTSQPVLPPIEKTPVWINDQPRSSFPSLPPAPPPPQPTSILKKPSTVLSEEVYNPLSAQTHEKVLEELRKQHKNMKDGTYRVKKIHILEKNDLEKQPSTVSFNVPPPPPPPHSTKASQSILRSEKLFFSQLFHGKK